jgi:ASC-1-like (ASCH) protein
MDHIAIMRKSLGYLDKIISGKKDIESRWYSSRRAPWDRIQKGDRVYFQNSGSPVTVEAKVKAVSQYENLVPEKVKDIITMFGIRIGIEDSDAFFKKVKDKRYCILVFLEDIREIPPFFIDKTGFGIMSAWISVETISRIKKQV